MTTLRQFASAVAAIATLGAAAAAQAAPILRRPLPSNRTRPSRPSTIGTAAAGRFTAGCGPIGAGATAMSARTAPARTTVRIDTDTPRRFAANERARSSDRAFFYSP